MFNNKRGNFRLSAYADEFGMVATFSNVPKKLKIAIQNLDQLERITYNKFPVIEPITNKDFQNLRYLVNDLRGYAARLMARQDYAVLEALIYKDELWVPGKPVHHPPEKKEEPKLQISDLEDPEEFVPRDPEAQDVPRGFARHQFFNRPQNEPEPVLDFDRPYFDEDAVRLVRENMHQLYPNIFGNNE